MSWYLALDTATQFGSVAVGTAGSAAVEVSLGLRRQAAALVPAIEDALRLAGIGFAQLEGLVLADGPGSFTGLRIGFATAKGLWHRFPALELFTLPSLAGLAWQAWPYASGPVAALYDALRGEVFAGIYRFDEGRAHCLLEPRLVGAGELLRLAPRPALAVGDGAAAHAGAVEAWTGRPPVGPPAAVPRAGALLELLVQPGVARPVADPVAAQPFYGRPAEAQARWERAHGQALPHSLG